MEIKKIILTLALFSSSLTANALEFLGFKLDNATHQEIHQLLINNGASLKNKNPLSSVYIVKGNKIPNASWIKTYFNDEDKFIGLQIGFPYQKTSTLPMRRALTEKYGHPVKGEGGFNTVDGFSTKDSYHSVAVWKFPDGTSITYDADIFQEVPEDIKRDRSLSTNIIITYRHDKRKAELVKKLKEQSYQNEKNKIKQVF